MVPGDEAMGFFRSEGREAVSMPYGPERCGAVVVLLLLLTPH